MLSLFIESSLALFRGDVGRQPLAQLIHALGPSDAALSEPGEPQMVTKGIRRDVTRSR